MRRRLRHICCVMLAVVLATVLAPTFASEAVAGENTHVDHAEQYGNALETQDHHGTPRGDDPGSQHQHPCAGHALCHLAAALGSIRHLGTVGLADEIADGDRLSERSHGSRVPQHPPQVFRLA